MKAGVLALQGDVEEHIYAFRRAAEELGLSVEVVQVKRPGQLGEVDALAIPGGESTTIGALARRAGLLEPLREAIRGGLPTLGTCAGAVFMAKEAVDAVVGATGQPLLGVMGISVVRNAFGRQRESFEAELELEELGRLRGVFIRAPAIVKGEADVKLLGPVPHPQLGRVYTAAIQRHMVATVFHPELSSTALHRYLLKQAKR